MDSSTSMGYLENRIRQKLGYDSENRFSVTCLSSP